MGHAKLTVHALDKLIPPAVLPSDRVTNFQSEVSVHAKAIAAGPDSADAKFIGPHILNLTG